MNTDYLTSSPKAVNNKTRSEIMLAIVLGQSQGIR